MAAPTSTYTYRPNLRLDVTGSNVDAGNNDYDIPIHGVRFDHGFSIMTGTLTNMTVTVLASNDNSNFVDITNDLFGVSSLASSTGYICDVNLPVNFLRIRAARSNATNAVAFSALFLRK